MIGSHPGGTALTGRLLGLAGVAPADCRTGESGTERKVPLKVLDLGAGNGETMCYLLEQGFDVSGVDRKSEPPAREAVRGRIKKGDMTALPFPDQSFDLCMAECSVSVCGDGPAALKEAYRVLRWGGSLLLSDVCFSKENAPCLSMPGSVTRPLWERECVRAGFAVRAWRDETPLWREFFLESLWNDNADEEFCDFYRTAGKAGCGYFLAWLLKVQPGNVRCLSECFLLDRKVAEAHERNFHECFFQ